MTSTFSSDIAYSDSPAASRADRVAPSFDTPREGYGGLHIMYHEL